LKPKSSDGSIVPLAPPDGESGGGARTFAWRANQPLLSHQAYELVFWKSSQDPLALGFGLVALTTETQVTADLDAIDRAPNHPLSPGDYQWGVILVERQPYRRLRYLGGGWSFTFTSEPGGQESGSSGGRPGSR
jgi:hypothetical protein